MLSSPFLPPEETVDFLGVVQPVTSSVEDGAEGGGVGRPGKKEGPPGVFVELEL